jgi:AbrB family looped-hinge helix DNA binding protein
MLELTVDKGGRVVIPKSLRRDLRLQPGDKLAVEQEGEKMILRPIRSKVGLKKKYGVWVYGTDEPHTVSEVDLIEQSREDRIRELSK